jgi:hypothetical protein
MLALPQIKHQTSKIKHLISFSSLTLACPSDDTRPVPQIKNNQKFSTNYLLEDRILTLLESTVIIAPEYNSLPNLPNNIMPCYF